MTKINAWALIGVSVLLATWSVGMVYFFATLFRAYYPEFESWGGATIAVAMSGFVMRGLALFGSEFVGHMVNIRQNIDEIRGK